MAASPSKNANDIFNNAVRAITALGMVWLINTANTNAGSLNLMFNEIGHIKTNQERQYKDLAAKMADRFTGRDGERLESDIKELEKEIDSHKDKSGH